MIRKLEGHTGPVDAVAVSSILKLVASASVDKTVRLWNSGSGHLVQTLAAHSVHVMGIAFSPDGKILASASADKTIKLWKQST